MSRQAPRPKRTADVYARTHHQESEVPSSKKPRFDARNPSTLAPDAPEEDAVLDLDEIGKGGQTKRNAVNIDGYESDSDNDNFDARARAKAKQLEREKESNDMFDDLEEDEEEDKVKKKSGKGKKDVRFLDVEEIEGQVLSSKSGGHVSGDFSAAGKRKVAEDGESSSEDEEEAGKEEEEGRVGSDVDEELGAGAKKKHAPKLDAFNMRDEQEEGAFDDTGNFVRKAMDPDSVHDSWLEGVSKKEMKRAREAQEKRDEERRQKNREDDALVTSDILSILIRHLHLGETVLEALQRLGKSKAKSKPKSKWQKNKAKSNGGQNGDAMEMDASAEDVAEARRKEAVEAITGAADQLMTRGDLEIYDHERGLLIRMYKTETGEDWVDPPSAGEVTGLVEKNWEYRWADGRDGEVQHGPYDATTMKAWNEAGYFGEGVEFRAVGEDEWSRVVDF